MAIETKDGLLSHEAIQGLRKMPTDEEKLAEEKLERLERAAQLNTFLLSVSKEVNSREEGLPGDLAKDFKLATSIARVAIFWSNEDLKSLACGVNQRSSADGIMSGQLTLRNDNIAITSVIPTRAFRVEIVKFLTSISTDLQAVEYQMTWITPPWLSTKR